MTSIRVDGFRGLPVGSGFDNNRIEIGATHLNKEAQDTEAKTAALRQIRQKRSLLDGDLPFYDSIIGVSLFLVLCEYEVRGQHPRLKDVQLELSRSQGAVRRLVRALAADGWVELVRSNSDQRSRHIVPTARLKRAIDAYLQTLRA